MVLTLVPGRSLGEFELGTLLWNVLTILRSSQNLFPNAQICWDARESATSFIQLSISSPAIQLIFDGRTQRLVLIEAYNPIDQNFTNRMIPLGEWISYRNQPISLSIGPNDPGVTLRVIHRLFGPTYPPLPHVAHPEETLISYPGVAFSFQNQVLNRVILSVQPSEINEDESESHQLAEAYYKPKMPQYLDCIDGDISCAAVRLGSRPDSIPTTVCFSFKSSSPSNPISDVNVVIGESTSEDIMCDFGAPLRTFWKEDDRMKIHAHLKSTGRPNGTVDEPNPYFMSYYNLGLDFLIDPISNVVIKIILHSNIPGEVLFARYSRCPWSICRPTATEAISSLEKCTSIIRYIKGEGSTHPRSSTSDQSHRTQKHSNHTPKSSGETDSAPAATYVEPAMVLDRTADVMDDGLTLQKPTRLIGFDGAVLEVTDNDDIETLWLF
ncbi:uncharacterized protein MELLADRAFT_115857 [Melampsora larici-populina 98AG31]|uniref:Uncharacterized protein n=1 Tax=Melampsora larici-populina (strain 98AG31 / pathotype 3-4-7) TaxID=747676 RepID=F4REX8_MELLP|nr:uncharacterized protein MELLADRAFT_115857 [Melampsora larici-populina 98AG31]EGG09185.1 hypothetical protein MELLADRAFT_115857 [Melampsora larici-populina 98AG31]